MCMAWCKGGVGEREGPSLSLDTDLVGEVVPVLTAGVVTKSFPLGHRLIAANGRVLDAWKNF